ncbi:ABC transporter permease [Mesorhizobium sp. SP-1A]|uniref:ABC transporter permease n=1 Tax=Mesorhizobium sp. SP-1A TaxID=3077840 RepID=UPI0028F6DD9D|nr:ABC transporter permease [Mesorhizobium sp. SP-1A]
MIQRLAPLLVQLTAFAALVAVWWGLSAGGIVDPFLLPPPWQVAQTLVGLVGRSDTWNDLGQTLSAVLASAAIAVPAGALIGFASAASPYWKEVLKPILYFPLSIPKSIFLPLFILAFGIGPTETIAFGTFSILFLMVVTAMAAVEAVTDDHRRVAHSYGATFRQTVRYVYLPSMMPVLLEGVRLSFIFGFTGVLVAEMYASRGGIGRSLASWGESFQVDMLLAGVIIVGVVAIAINEIVRFAERRAERWRV